MSDLFKLIDIGVRVLWILVAIYLWWTLRQVNKKLG